MKRSINLKKPLAILIALTMLMSAVVATSALANEAEKPVELIAAETLHSLGLFRGYGDDAAGNPIFGLGETSTRMQGMIMFLRLLGVYE